MVTVTVDANEIPVAVMGMTSENCGLSDGTATVTVSSGLPPYTYEWSTIPIQNTATALNLIAGDYTVTLTDANACVIIETITVTGSVAVTVSISTENSNCGQANGSATAAPSNGLPPYTYEWNTVPVQNMAAAIDLMAGAYEVTVTDANMCTVVGVANISDEGAPTLVLSATSASCGGSDGSASVEVSGGLAPYSYLWDSSPSQDVGTAISLSGGTYSVTVTDFNGCAVSGSIVVDNTNSFDLTTTTTEASCGEANATATVLASTSAALPLTYTWSTDPVQTTETAINLTAGTYSVTVSDYNNCAAIASVTIGFSETPIVFIDLLSDGICGIGGGAAAVNVISATQPYTYVWDTDPVETEQSISDVLPGTYSVTVTDASNCSASSQVTIPGVLQTPVVTCGASTTSSVSFTWAAVPEASSYVLNLEGEDISLLSTDTSYVVTNIAENSEVSITLTAIGTGNCSNSASTIFSCIANDCPAPTAVIEGLDLVYCNEESAVVLSALPSGGIFTIDTTIITSINPSILANGTYAVNYNYTDENDCTFNASQVVSISGIDVIVSPNAIVLQSGESTNITSEVLVGLSDSLTYTWLSSGTDSISCANCADIIVSPTISTTYSLMVSDGDGCTASANVLVTINNLTTAIIPNAFSPNNDGHNDTFGVKGNNIERYQLNVYNRWGQVVFATTNLGDNWDGSHKGIDAPIGTYVYYAQIIFTDGSSKSLKGNVVLIR